MKIILEKVLEFPSFRKFFSVKQVSEFLETCLDARQRDHLIVKEIKEKKIFLEVDDPIISMELGFIKTGLLEKIKEHFGKDAFTDVVFRTRITGSGRRRRQ
jgi:hypothetical protein